MLSTQTVYTNLLVEFLTGRVSRYSRFVPEYSVVPQTDEGGAVVAGAVDVFV